MTFKEKRLYRRIRRLIETTPNYNAQYHRYETDIINESLFLYPDSGKIMGTKSLTIFRNNKDCWKLIPDLEKILTELTTV